MTPPGRASFRALLLIALALPACTTTDDARVLQVLNQRGFGRPTQDANRQYYLGIGDRVIVRVPDYKEYSGQSETIRMDGTVTLEDVGEVYVNGLTPEEASTVVARRYDELITDTSRILVQVVSIQSKKYYITGAPPRKPLRRPFKGDTTLLDVMTEANIDENLVDTDNIKVIRGDPENPLVISCDYDAIKRRGLTRDNILIRENDIVYLTPSWIGYLTWGVDALLAPLQPIQQFIFGFNNIIAVSDSFGQGTFGAGKGGKFKNFNF